MLNQHSHESLLLHSVFLPERKKARVVMLGFSGVGKSSIASQFLVNRFSSEYTPTTKPIPKIVRSRIELEIVDTPGSGSVLEAKSVPIPPADVYLLLFAVDVADSFDFLAELRHRLASLSGRSIPIVVAGNKCEAHSDRSVPYALADCVVNIDWGMKYMEVTATDNDSVRRLFECICNCLIPNLFPDAKFKMKQPMGSEWKGVTPRKVKTAPSKKTTL